MILLRGFVLFVSLFVFSTLGAIELDFDGWTYEDDSLPGKLELSPWRGLQFRTKKDAFTSKLGGIFSLDYQHLDIRNRKSSGGRVDRAILRWDSTWQNRRNIFSWRVAPDLKGVDTRGLDEVWLSYLALIEKAPLRLSFGLFEMPLSAEHSIQENELPFSQYGFPAYLDSRSDIGIRLEGTVYGVLYYDLAITLGEGFNRSGERASGERIAARFVLYPVKAFISELKAMQGLFTPMWRGFFGSVAFSYTLQPQGKLTVSNPLRNELFTVGRLRATSSAFLYYAYGFEFQSFRFIHEAVRGGYHDLETVFGDRDLDNQITAWSMSLSWMVTGEWYDSLIINFNPKAKRKRVLRPLWVTDPRTKRYKDNPRIYKKGWGALELAARYSNGDIDREFFVLGFTDYTTSSQEFRSFTFAVNWYPIENIRWSFQVVRTLADQRPVTFDSHGRDTSYLIRMQYVF